MVALFRDAYADVLTTAKWRNLECSNENSLKLLTKTQKYNDGADTSSHVMDVTRLVHAHIQWWVGAHNGNVKQWQAGLNNHMLSRCVKTGTPKNDICN